MQKFGDNQKENQIFGGVEKQNVSGKSEVFLRGKKKRCFFVLISNIGIKTPKEL